MKFSNAGLEPRLQLRHQANLDSRAKSRSSGLASTIWSTPSFFDAFENRVKMTRSRFSKIGCDMTALGFEVSARYKQRNMAVVACDNEECNRDWRSTSRRAF